MCILIGHYETVLVLEMKIFKGHGVSLFEFTLLDVEIVYNSSSRKRLINGSWGDFQRAYSFMYGKFQLINCCKAADLGSFCFEI